MPKPLQYEASPAGSRAAVPRHFLGTHAGAQMSRPCHHIPAETSRGRRAAVGRPHASPGATDWLRDATAPQTRLCLWMSTVRGGPPGGAGGRRPLQLLQATRQGESVDLPANASPRRRAAATIHLSPPVVGGRRPRRTWDQRKRGRQSAASASPRSTLSESVLPLEHVRSRAPAGATARLRRCTVAPRSLPARGVEGRPPKLQVPVTDGRQLRPPSTINGPALPPCTTWGCRRDI
jgi:hypothetical protein